MATTDKNGIVRFSDADIITPLAPVLNSIGSSVSSALDKNARIWNVANTSARSALVAQIGASNISLSSPLFVWRADAATGLNLEYTINGVNWFGYGSTAIPKDDTGWIDLTYEAGYTAGTAKQLRYRIRDGVVYIQGGATGPFTSGSYKTVAMLPVAARPSEDQIRAGAAGSSGRAGLWEVNKTGEIKFAFNAWGSSGVPAWMAMSCSYPLG